MGISQCQVEEQEQRASLPCLSKTVFVLAGVILSRYRANLSANEDAIYWADFIMQSDAANSDLSATCNTTEQIKADGGNERGGEVGILP